MNVLIATDFRLYEYNERFYLNETTFTTIFRYKKVFGDIALCTRVINVDKIDNKVFDATELLSSIIKIKSLKTALFDKHKNEMIDAIRKVDLVIARVPSIIAYKAGKIARKLNKPVFALAMGDAWDSYFNHGLTGKAIAPYMFLEMKRIMKNSDYALYVTSEFLQKRYPCHCHINAGISDVKLTEYDDALKKRVIKIDKGIGNNISFITVGDVESRIKGQKYVFYALKKLIKKGYNIKYILVGEGNQDYLKKYAKKYRVSSNVLFTGRLNYEQIKGYLDEADIYLHPSLQEGMPRAVLEAMSRACPIIASNVGGIPEIIDSKYIVRPRDKKSIYKKILNLLCNDELKEQAERNFMKSKEFDEERLSNMRKVFYEKIISDIIGKRENV